MHTNKIKYVSSHASHLLFCFLFLFVSITHCSELVFIWHLDRFPKAIKKTLRFLIQLWVLKISKVNIFCVFKAP